MSTPLRSATVLAIVVLAAAALVGCDALGGPVTDKTNAILRELKDLPGVTEATSTVGERSPSSEPHSEIRLTVDPAATSGQLVAIVTTFVTANRETGLDTVVSELDLGSGDDTLQLLYGDATAGQATALAESWLDLRGDHGTTDLGLVVTSGRSGYVVNLGVEVPESSFAGDLVELRDAVPVFAALGPVGRYEQVNGRFAASAGLPDAAALQQLAVLDTVLAADGTDPDLRGEYDGLQSSFSLVASVADSTDAGNGLNAAAVRALAAIPATGAGIAIAFRSAADRHEIAMFDDRSCDGYAGLPAADPSRQLVELWAQDGRTLLDGSTVASCFA